MNSINAQFPQSVPLRALFFSIFLIFGLVGCTAESVGSNLPIFSREYDPDRDAFADARAALALAAETNRRVLIEVGGNWCGWCRALKATLNKHEALKEQQHNAFVVLKVNVSDDNENEAFLSTFPETLGYPHIYITENDGTVLHSQDTAEFVEDGRYSVDRLNEFFSKWKSKL